jgi:polyhydroxyalkanoate synthesis regulator phasin
VPSKRSKPKTPAPAKTGWDKAVADFEARLHMLQVRAAAEGQAVTRVVENAVQATLARLNIPSRGEIQALTRKVDELSRKIDRLRR